MNGGIGTDDPRSESDNPLNNRTYQKDLMNLSIVSSSIFLNLTIISKIEMIKAVLYLVSRKRIRPAN